MHSVFAFKVKGSTPVPNIIFFLSKTVEQAAHLTIIGGCEGYYRLLREKRSSTYKLRFPLRIV
jgi:hypothetical protein